MNIFKKILVGVIFMGTLVVVAPKIGLADTVSDLQAQIQALLKQVIALQAQLQQQQQGQQTAVWCHTFTQNELLRVGESGSKVEALQMALSKEGFKNWEYKGFDGEFDEVTASVVSEFQEKYASEILTPNGLKRGTGFVGASTKKKLNQLYGCGNIPVYPQPTTDTPSGNLCPPIVQPSCKEGTLVSGGFDGKGCALPPKCVEEKTSCVQVATRAKNPQTGVCQFFSTPCDIPSGWVKVESCMTEPASQPSITVISPNGGETWEMGKTYNITWKAEGTTDNFEIYLRDDRAGPAYKTIASEVPSYSRSYSFNLPVDFWGPYTAGRSYKIQVREMGGKAGGSVSEGVYDESDSDFSITSPSTATTTIKAGQVTPSLTVSSTPYVQNQNILINTSNQLLGGFNVNVAGGPLKVQKMVFRLATSPLSGVNNVVLVNGGGVVVAGPVSAVAVPYAGFETITFIDPVTFPIGSGSYTLRGELGNTFGDGQTFSVFTNPAQDWTNVVNVNNSGGAYSLTNTDVYSSTMTAKSSLPTSSNASQTAGVLNSMQDLLLKMKETLKNL